MNGIIYYYRWQVKQNVEDDQRNIIKFRNHWQKLNESLRDLYCNAVGPGQSEIMKRIVEPENLEDYHDDDENELNYFLDYYNRCIDSKHREMILRMIPEKFTKEKIAEKFNVSEWHIRKARHQEKFNKPLGEQEKPIIYRNRVNLEDMTHFINYLTENGLFQEEAYGTTTLKFDTGDTKVVSNSLLMAVPKHAVKEYHQYCSNIGRNCLSESTLCRILKACKPKTRRRLAGVDNFLVHGLEAIENLKKIANEIENADERKNIINRLNEVEKYLKLSRFQQHCSLDNECASHCIGNALTSTKNQAKCAKSHSATCNDCLNIHESIETLKAARSVNLSKKKKDNLFYIIDKHFVAIKEWQQHIIRGVQQTKAKTEALQNMTATEALWIRDWAQKVLPLSGLEAQDVCIFFYIKKN